MLNYRYVAYGQRELEDIKAQIPDCTDGVCKETMDLSEIDVDEIVKSVISRLRNY